MRHAVAVVVGCLALAGCAGGDDGAVAARVGQQEVTVLLVEQGLEDLRREYLREGREFPQRGTPGFETLRDQLVGELVEQARLEEKARLLGLEVDADELERRVAAAKAAEAGEEEGGSFVEHLVRGQLVYELLYEHATRNVRVTEDEIRALYERNREFYGGRTLEEMRPSLRQQILGEKRNRATSTFLEQVERELPVTYEPGYEPS